MKQKKCNENTSKDFLRENEVEKCFTNVNTAGKFHLNTEEHMEIFHTRMPWSVGCEQPNFGYVLPPKEDKVGTQKRVSKKEM